MRWKDRRKYIRLTAYHLVKFRLISDPTRFDTPVIGRVHNISAGGCCLITDKFLPKGSIIEVRINFPNLNQPVFARAQVVWAKQIGKTDQFKFGIQFIQIDEEVRKIMDEQIKFVCDRLEGGFFKIFRKKGGEKKMKMIAKLFIVAALLCLLLAIVIKLTSFGTVLPGAMPINWVKLADTALLFAIALILLSDKSK